MRRSLLAGAAYFAIVFGAGFALGIVRTLVLEPAVDKSVAVALELPIILAIAWFASLGLTRRFAIPDRLLPRAGMGATALILLLLGELAISLTLAERGVADHFLLYREPAHLLGLAGQLAFASFPALQIWNLGERRRADN